MPTVKLVPTHFVHQTWPVVSKFLAGAIAYAQGDLTLDQLKADLGMNRAALYIVCGDTGGAIGAAAVGFQNRSNQRVAFVIALGGSGIVTPNTYGEFVALLKRDGATHIEGVGRPAITRLYRRLGMQEKYTTFGAKL